jgi:hypothetical protein
MMHFLTKQSPKTIIHSLDNSRTLILIATQAVNFSTNQLNGGTMNPNSITLSAVIKKE